ELITLYVYAGQNGTFTLYEDEGVNYNYEKGQYATIPFTYNDASRSLTIGKREGEFPGMLLNRKFNIVIIDKNTPKPFDLNAKGTVVEYDGKEQTITI
ncbi:Alpha-xylosidase BoGH31A, partial [termite gut metagenome]